METLMFSSGSRAGVVVEPYPAVQNKRRDIDAEARGPQRKAPRKNIKRWNQK